MKTQSKVILKNFILLKQKFHEAELIITTTITSANYTKFSIIQRQFKGLIMFGGQLLTSLVKKRVKNMPIMLLYGKILTKIKLIC